MNKPNPSTSGHYPAPFSTDCTKASTTEGTHSGTTGMDQSANMGSCQPKTSNGNTLPALPPIKRGN